MASEREKRRSEDQVKSECNIRERQRVKPLNQIKNFKNEHNFLRKREHKPGNISIFVTTTSVNIFIITTLKGYS